LTKEELTTAIVKFESFSSQLYKIKNDGTFTEEISFMKRKSIKRKEGVDTQEVVDLQGFRDMQGLLGKYYLSECIFNVIVRIRDKFRTNKNAGRCLGSDHLEFIMLEDYLVY
jgi:hypothetical protein